MARMSSELVIADSIRCIFNATSTFVRSIEAHGDFRDGWHHLQVRKLIKHFQQCFA